MTTAHILPGYGYPVARLRRAKTAYPLDKTKLREYALQNVPPPERSELGDIRDQARRMWMGLEREKTSYDCHFQFRPLDAPTKSRPTELSRRNKPHPPLVFLTNRLHYIPGYHNADTTINKPTYQIDASLPPEEQYYRRAVRDKYIGRPTSAAINQYTDKFGYRQIMDPVEAQAAEAWTKIADDKDVHQVVNVLEEYKGEPITDPKKEHVPITEPDRPKTANPSLHRWMKYAGAAENVALHKALDDLRNAYDKEALPNMMRYTRSAHGSTDGRRQADIQAMNRIRPSAKLSRGDFLMHPDWPPTIPHHAVP
ncbi:hypothetical protein FSP39_003927 [Pinctada imbricata]|uniref:Uncharacterized protein n=1 Tax=Pinctada imbricata TaxID=66713 RepID=A0AA88Y7J8_PINIB|nr:hypothetical protein FSP39_003927 [Pinctada imbricata]